MKNLYKYRNKKESPHFWGQGFCRYWCHLWIYESVFSQFRFLRFLNPNAFRSIFLIRKPYCPWPPIHTDVTGPWMQRDDTMFRINERKKRGKKKKPTRFHVQGLPINGSLTQQHKKHIPIGWGEGAARAGQTQRSAAGLGAPGPRAWWGHGQEDPAGCSPHVPCSAAPQLWDGAGCPLMAAPLHQSFVEIS